MTPIPPQLVWFETTSRPFGAPDGLRPHTGQVGRLVVTERYDAANDAPYTIRAEGLAATLEELYELRHEAFSLANHLDLVWPYVAGVPLFPTVRTVNIAYGPRGWNSNSEDARGVLVTGRARVEFEQLVSRYRVDLPYLPLEAGLRALRSLRAADNVTRFLIDLHFASMRDLTGSGSKVFLSKCLEIVRAVLPGRTDEQRQKALPAEIQPRLTRNLHWLYGIANERFEIRHVVRNPAKLEFHSSLTNAERRDYECLGDLVLRAVICERLGIPLVAVDRA